MYFSYFYCPYRFSYENFFNDAYQSERFPDSFSGTQSATPPGAPPTFIPSKAGVLYTGHGGGPGTFLVGTGLINTCINQFVYIWTENGNQYWFWLNNVSDRRYISGLRWTGSNWVKFSENFSNIQGYYCYNPFRPSES